MKKIEMYGSNLLIVGIVILSAFLIGCKKDLVSSVEVPDVKHSIYGKVIDENGNPVDGVKVHYIFAYNSGDLSKIQGSNYKLEKNSAAPPETQITFSIPTNGKVKVSVLRWFTRELITVLVDDTLQSGVYSFNINPSLLTNGLYLYKFEIEKRVIEKMMVNRHTSFNELISSIPLTKSDGAGLFELPYGLLGFRVPIYITSPYESRATSTSYILPTIQIVLYKPGYELFVKEVRVPQNIDLNETFMLKKY